MGARELLAHLASVGLHLSLRADTIVVTPRALLTDDLRRAIKANRAALIHALAPAQLISNPMMTAKQADACHTGAWDDTEIARFVARRDRLVSLGYTELDAEHLAERLTHRDRESDERVNCADCRHCRTGRCGNHRYAGVGAPELSRDLMAMLQRCAGFCSVEAEP